MSQQPPQLDADLSFADWQAIEELLDELAKLARAGVPAAVFQRTLLERLVPALSASSGAVWSRDRHGDARLEQQFPPVASRGAQSTDPGDLRRSAVAEVLTSQATKIAGPRNASGASAWQVLHPFGMGDAPSTAGGVLEILTTREITPAAGRAYQRVLAAAAEVIEDFNRRHELAALRSAANEWHDYDQFARTVHQSLELEQAAYAIANEARRVVRCDRVSVLETRGKALRALAISGVDRLERRAPAVRALEKLAARAAVCGEPVWYHDGVADLPDEVLGPLHAYLELSHARVLAIVPLREPEDHDASPADRERKLLGLLVAEHFEGTSTPEVFRDRLLAIARHAEAALHNARTHWRMPLARASRVLKRIGCFTGARQLPRTLLVTAALTAIVTTLVLVPADFNVEAKGELQPSQRREVFASDDGVVSELLVSAGQTVAAGEPLIVLRKAELDLEIRRVLGERQTAEKKLAAVRAERLQDAPEPGSERRRDPHELAADEEQLKASLEGLSEQQQILEAQREALTIRSPIAGEALTWNVEQLLAARPVERGQALLTVANVAGPWELDLHVPDDRAGHVLAASEAGERDLEVDFRLTSDPDQTYRGRLVKLARTTELDAQHTSSVRGTIAFDRDEVPALRPGATAIAQIHCGQRSLGYVWFHDLYDYARSWWW